MDSIFDKSPQELLLQRPQPWKVFFYHFNATFQFEKLQDRVLTNIFRYLMNYAVIVLLGLLCFSYKKPILLLVIPGFLLIWYTVTYHRDSRFVNTRFAPQLLMIVWLVITFGIVIYGGGYLYLLISGWVTSAICFLHALFRSEEKPHSSPQQQVEAKVVDEEK